MIGTPPDTRMMAENGSPMRGGATGRTTATMKLTRLAKEESKGKGKGVRYKRGKPGRVAKGCRAKSHGLTITVTEFTIKRTCQNHIADPTTFTQQGTTFTVTTRYSSRTTL